MAAITMKTLSSTQVLDVAKSVPLHVAGLLALAPAAMPTQHGMNVILPKRPSTIMNVPASEVT